MGDLVPRGAQREVSMPSDDDSDDNGTGAPSSAASTSAPTTAVAAAAAQAPPAAVGSSSTTAPGSSTLEHASGLHPSEVTTTRKPFIQKLYAMLQNPSYKHLISWSPGGFCVHAPDEFSRNVLPVYFKHANFSSFVRQINMYGFRKNNDVFSTGSLDGSPPVWEFHHPDFQEARPELLSRIKRKAKPQHATAQPTHVGSPLPPGRYASESSPAPRSAHDGTHYSAPATAAGSSTAAAIAHMQAQLASAAAAAAAHAADEPRSASVSDGKVSPANENGNPSFASRPAAAHYYDRYYHDDPRYPRLPRTADGDRYSTAAHASMASAPYYPPYDRPAFVSPYSGASSIAAAAGVPPSAVPQDGSGGAPRFPPFPPHQPASSSATPFAHQPPPLHHQHSQPQLSSQHAPGLTSAPAVPSTNSCHCDAAQRWAEADAHIRSLSEALWQSNQETVAGRAATFAILRTLLSVVGGSNCSLSSEQQDELENAKRMLEQVVVTAHSPSAFSSASGANRHASTSAAPELRPLSAARSRGPSRAPSRGSSRAPRSPKSEAYSSRSPSPAPPVDERHSTSTGDGSNGHSFAPRWPHHHHHSNSGLPSAARSTLPTSDIRGREAPLPPLSSVFGDVDLKRFAEHDGRPSAEKRAKHS